MWVLSSRFVQGENQGEKMMAVSSWIFTLCWQINHLFYPLWTVSLLVKPARSSVFHYTASWWQRKSRGESEPRDDSRVWLPFRDSSTEDSIGPCDTGERQPGLGMEPNTFFPGDDLPPDSVELHFNSFSCPYLNFIQTAESAPPWME